MSVFFSVCPPNNFRNNGQNAINVMKTLCQRES